MDHQLDYMIDMWPVAKGITTHYVAGDDHEGWYQQREGIKSAATSKAERSSRGATTSSISDTVRPILSWHIGSGRLWAVSYTPEAALLMP